jgi:hypothetical protein
MNWSKWIRASHRWFGMALIVLTIINAIAFSLGYAIPWLYYSPLVPLFLQMAGGLYLFVLPYLRKSKST